MIKDIARKIGIDKAISYVLIGRGISLVSQPLTLLFIGKYLTKIEQGFYYTFSNIISLSIFLELGLGTILTQFASHEFAHLKWSKNKLTGDETSLNRLLSLTKKSIIWYNIMVVIFMAIIIPVGIYFFQSQASDVNYVIPWILLVFFSAINLVIYSFTAIMEGCDKVADVQLLKMIQSILSSILIWVVLVNKGGLFASTIIAFTQCVISIIWLRVKYVKIIKQALTFNLKNNKHNISWRKEIFPLQWKIALSWMSGYIISQAINPALFTYRGAVEAGQMGMSISIANLPLVIGLAWLSTKSPTYGSYINANKIGELKKIVRKNTIISSVVTILASVFLMCGVIIVKKYFEQYGERFLPTYSLLYLLIANLASNIITSLALYMRAFKREPLLIFSVVNAVLMGLGIFLSAKFANAQILCIVTSSITIFVAAPYCYLIFKNFQKKFNFT